MAGGGLYARLMTAQAFFRARGVMRRLRTRADVERWQARRLDRFFRQVVPRVSAYFASGHGNLSDFPYTDKSRLMANFAAYNRLGLTADDGWAHLAAGTAPEGYAVGASTGTSGNRGLYIVSDRERYLWLGVMLAKALPDVLTARHRVAVVLPTGSRLYDAANESGRLALKFFSLSSGIEAVLSPAAAFRPSVIVAPPKVLRALADADLDLSPQRVFSGAEVLDPIDRAAVEARFGNKVREIYMATEGLLGVSCEHGTLHLCEDTMAFELEPVGDDPTAVSPVITDFSRRTQVMLRYRMNDILRLREEPCPCGSPLQAVSEVVGRLDDVFELVRADGAGRIRMTPDVIRNTVLGADRRISDFRVVQVSPAKVRLSLAPGFEAAGQAAEAALVRLFAGAGAKVDIERTHEPMSVSGERKLRRVMRLPEAN